MTQTIIVTLVALVALGVVVRRLLALRRQGDQPHCEGCDVPAAEARSQASRR